MSDFLGTIVSMSIGGSILIALILLTEKMAGRAMGRQWRYYIWLLVIARLLIPFGPTMSFGSGYAVDEATSVWPSGLEAGAEYSKLPALADIDLPDMNSQAGPIQDAAGADHGAAQQHEDWSSPWQNALRIAFIIWACGCLALLTRRITAYQSFQKYVRAGMVPVCDPHRLNLAAEAAAQCGVRRPVEVAVNPLISSPMLIGLIHPCIVLPNDKLSDAEFHFVALHELTHLCRLDLVYKWLVQICVCVHWFNPLVYVMEKRIRQACEFSCDEAVVRRGGPDSAVPYGMTLLNAMASAGTYSEPAAAVNLSESKRLLKERLGEMRTYESRRKAPAIVLSILIAVCLVAATACTGVYRAGLREGWFVPVAGHISSDRKLEELGPMPSDGHIRLDLKDCAVRILDTADLETAEGQPLIAASYDPAKFSIRRLGQTIQCRSTWTSGSSRSPQVLELFLPVDALETAEINADGCFLDFDSVPNCDIFGAALDGMTIARFPTEYSGTFSLSCPDGFTVLQSSDEFAGTAVTVTGEFVAAPENASRTGERVTLDNGDTGLVDIDAEGGMVSFGTDVTAGALDKLEELDSLSEENKAHIAEAFADVIADKAEGLAERIENGAMAWASAIEEAFENRTAPPAPSAPKAPRFGGTQDASAASSEKSRVEEAASSAPTRQP